MPGKKFGCAYLNELVKTKTEEVYLRTSQPSTEFATAKAINYEVYQRRDNRLTYTLWCISAWIFYITIPKMSYPTFLLTFLICWINTDLYTGIVHLVLEHRDTIHYKLPDLWRPALEFQWHHLLPHDIVDKPIMFVLGDLNRAVTLHLVAIIVSALHYGIDDPIYHFSLTCKLAMAYTAQLSHRLTHLNSTRKPWFAWPFEPLLLQKVEHQMHHKDHDMNFTILNGLFNPPLNMLAKIIGLETVWPYLGILGFLTFFDCHYIAHHFVPAIISLSG